MGAIKPERSERTKKRLVFRIGFLRAIVCPFFKPRWGSTLRYRGTSFTKKRPP